MSFILDALRKAEQERRLRQTPRLGLVLHSPSPPRRHRRWPVVGFAAAVLLAGNALLLVWLLRPAWLTADPAAFAEAARAAVSIADRPLALASAPRLSELPVRQSLPALSVDIHVYSDVPERRFVLINGKHYRQGDWLEEGPLLESIDADSVTLSYREQRFTLAVKR